MDVKQADRASTGLLAQSHQLPLVTGFHVSPEGRGILGLQWVCIVNHCFKLHDELFSVPMRLLLCFKGSGAAGKTGSLGKKPGKLQTLMLGFDANG